jgi:hypothetical protein
MIMPNPGSGFLLPARRDPGPEKLEHKSCPDVSLSENTGNCIAMDRSPLGTNDPPTNTSWSPRHRGTKGEAL